MADWCHGELKFVCRSSPMVVTFVLVSILWFEYPSMELVQLLMQVGQVIVKCRPRGVYGI